MTRLWYPDGSPALMPAPHPIYNPSPNYAELLGKKYCLQCNKLIRDKPVIGTLHVCVAD